MYNYGQKQNWPWNSIRKMTESQVNELLLRSKSKYKDIAKRDIVRTISTFKELVPNIEKYVFADGNSTDLFTLNGTIPVKYKSSLYNIPVQFYLIDMFPYHPPMCYVRPTQDMSVNVSDHVDPNGRINLPYLRNWQYPKCDLNQFVSELQKKFSETTPLYAKSSRTSTSSSSSLQYPYGCSTPAYPSSVNAAAASSLPYPTATAFQQHSNAQTPPPYPTTSFQQPSAVQTPPYPTQYSQPQPNTNTPFYGYPYVPGFAPVSMPTPASIPGQVSSSSVRPPIPPPPPQSQPIYPTGMATRSNYNEDTIKPEFYKASLVSAVEDRVKERLSDLMQLKSGELESLRKSNDDLLKGEKQLKGIMSEAEAEISSIKKHTCELKQKICVLNENIGKIRHRDNSNIEDAIVAPAPLYRQIMQLYAEEMALQDLMYFLNEGLLHKTISLDLFLKQIRFLSRKQFMSRALIQKCREQAGLRP